MIDFNDPIFDLDDPIPPFPYDIDKYEHFKEKGSIKEEDIILTPPVQKDLNINGYKKQLTEPGWVDVMNSIAGEGKWGCHSSISFFDISRTTMLYEIEPYFTKEINNQSEELGLDTKKGNKWLISINYADCSEENFDNYYSFVEKLFRALENQQYNVFTICSISDPTATSIKYEDMGIKFLGIYALDRKKSLLHRRLIFHHVSDWMSLQKNSDNCNKQ